MKLAVIILNWNGKTDTLACLKSLGQFSRSKYEIIVVDNGSTDGSVRAISCSFPEVTLIQARTNLGYAGGNNLGIRRALSNPQIEFILILNNDTLLGPHSLEAFLKKGNSSSKLGIVGGYPLSFHDPSQIDHLGGIWNRQTASFDLVGRGASRGFVPRVALDYVCGCSILIKRKVFETIGELESKFFLFWEEADFCFRAKQAGFDIAVCQDATLLHKISASFIGGSPQKAYFWWRGRGLFIERNFSSSEVTYLYKKVLKKELLHLRKLWWIKQGELYLLQLFGRKVADEKKKVKVFQYRASLQGFFDYKNSRFGEAPSWLFKNVLKTTNRSK